MKLIAYVDSDYAGNKTDRKSVTGFVIFLNGATVSWKSKKQRITTLSSTEAEYVALTHCVTEIIFIKNLLKEMKQKVKLPIIVKEDNAGALFLAKNHALGQRTKHIDVRYHYVRDLIEEGIIMMNYVKTEKNYADMLTKNVGEEKHEKFGNKLLTGLKDT